MLKRILSKYAPDPRKLESQWLFRTLGLYAQDVQLWSTSRRAVTRAAGLGLAICFLPLPIHTVLALLAALVWRLNLGVLLAAIYVVNPFTMLPIYYGAYRVGALLFGAPAEVFAFELSWHWVQHGLGPIWKPFLVGCLVCSLTLGYGTWLALEFAWRRNTRRKLQAKQQRISR
jgi:uncharacterized protein (DUF2062 family)